MRVGGNEYSVREAAGAFGDLGTLIPFLAGYIAIARMDPAGVLIAFGLFKILAGIAFKTPIPIQPMKAIGTAAISHAGTITPGAVWASGLFTGSLWLLLGMSGAVSWIARITSRPVVQGLVVGLGLGFLLEGLNLARGDLLLAAAAVMMPFVLLSHERVPAMLVLLVLGTGVAVAREPELLAELGQLSVRPRLPEFALTRIGWQDLLTGLFVLGLPQAALTLGNAIVATAEENNELFPDRPVTVCTLAIDHGIMNLVGTALGGVPMCHGAGGMAGHVRFGARTGGTVVMLGILVLFAGLFLADSVETLFKLFPPALLGVILMFGGLELAAGVRAGASEKADRYVIFFTAGVAMWNMGAGYLAGLALWHAMARGWVKT